MNPDQFTTLLAASALDPHGRTAAACRLVLVDGLTTYAAAHRIGVSESAVGRALRKIPRSLCPTCGQAVIAE